MGHKNKGLGLVVGANLKRLIKNSEYGTQEEFAFEFGASVKSVGRWINRGLNDLRTIEQIANFFDVDVFSILS